jgi:hypothetical protein
MLNTLASHNSDIKQLLDKGYALALENNCLAVRDIPYLDKTGALKWGAFVSKLQFIDKVRVQMDDHQIYFCGEHPCELDGTPIRNLAGGAMTMPLSSPDLIVQRSFSNKPVGGFSDLYEKFESYVNILSGPAIDKFNVSPLTFDSVDVDTPSVFHYRDTLTSRAAISDLTSPFSQDVVAIIGLGGTGAYVLDFLVKTPVMEIRGFDLDWFHVHNAFRSPGKLEEDELGKTKSEVYQGRYETFRTGIDLRSKLILADSLTELEGVTFAFVCVDKGEARAGIFNALVQLGIPFIDVGMGLARDRGPITGQVRTTYFSVEDAKHVIEEKLAPMSDLPEDVYRNNIQISELNALNACLAVIKYKQLRGFYAEGDAGYHMLFSIEDLKMYK